MPLENCRIRDTECIGRNISQLIKEGKKRSQAVAIAFSAAQSTTNKKRKRKRK